MQFRPKPKLIISSGRKRQEVTGLVVNGRSTPTISKSKGDLVRSAINNLRITTDFTQQVRDIESIRGRIACVKQVSPGTARRLNSFLNRLLVLKVTAPVAPSNARPSARDAVGIG